MRNRKIHGLDAAILILFCVLTVGVVTFLRPCGIHDDGSYSSCHWAGRILFGFGVLGVLQMILAFPGQKQFRLGVNMAVVLQALLMLLLPGRIVSLCGMSTMRCNIMMKPGVQVISILLALLAAINILLIWRSIQKEK